MIIKKIALFSLLVSALGTMAIADDAKFTLKVNVEGIESNEGQILVTLCKKEEFMKSKCEFSAMIKLSDDANRQLEFENIPSGEYALQMFHDVNNDYKLQTNLMGIPTEPFAFSNNAKGKFGPPKYEDAAFKITEATEISISFAQ